MRQIPKYLVLFAGLIAAYLVFAMGVSLLPLKPVEHHVSKTVYQNDLKADFWFAFLYKPGYFMDNFTDALIVNQAVTNGQSQLSLWKRVMLVPRRTLKGNEECDNLRRLVEGDGTLGTLYYPRYWHGSTFLMKALLTLTDYVRLRTFFYILSSLLLLWVLMALLRRVGAWSAVIYIVSLLSVNLFMMQHSIQFLPVLLLALGGSLWVLYRVKDASGMALMLFVLGSLTAYLDLLTCPLLTWGIPMLVWVLASSNNSRFNLLHFSLSTLLWAVGYAATWAAKWVLATLTTGVNVFADATDQAAIRSSVAGFSRWGAVVRNVEIVPWIYGTIVLAVLILLAVRHFNPQGWRRALHCLLVALAPLVWFLMLPNHSYEHYWFTYRILALTVMGLLAATACLVDWRRVKQKDK